MVNKQAWGDWETDQEGDDFYASRLIGHVEYCASIKKKDGIYVGTIFSTGLSIGENVLIVHESPRSEDCWAKLEEYVAANIL